MPSDPGLGPAIPRRRLGATLKQLRDERRKTLASVAEDLLISTSKLSRLEKGHAAPSDRDMRDLLRYFDQTDTELGMRMRAWAREAREVPWWEQDPDHAPSVTERHYMQYETAAAEIRGYVGHYVPSLLQTADYARHLIGVLDTEDAAEIDRLTELRLRRQEVIHRSRYEVKLDVVIDEAVFHRVVGSPHTMHEQLVRLAELSRMPNITLRVLTFAAGPHPAISEGAFSIFRFRRSIDPDIVHVESTVTDVFVEQHDRVGAYNRLLDGLVKMAMGADASTEFIERMSYAY